MICIWLDSKQQPLVKALGLFISSIQFVIWYLLCNWHEKMLPNVIGFPQCNIGQWYWSSSSSLFSFLILWLMYKSISVPVLTIHYCIPFSHVTLSFHFHIILSAVAWHHTIAMWASISPVLLIDISNCFSSEAVYMSIETVPSPLWCLRHCYITHLMTYQKPMMVEHNRPEKPIVCTNPQCFPCMHSC